MAQDKLYPCPRCSSPVAAKSSQCWKCGSRLKFVRAKKPEVATEAKDIAFTAELASQFEPEINSYSFGLTSLLLSMTLIAVCVALFAAAPGLGIIVAIFALPAFIRTCMVVQRRKQLGRRVAPEAKVGLYLGSFGVTMVVTVVTFIVSMATFYLALFALCFAIATLPQPAQESNAIWYLMLGFSYALTITVGGLIVYHFFKWIRHRWQRDIGQ